MTLDFCAITLVSVLAGWLKNIIGVRVKNLGRVTPFTDESENSITMRDVSNTYLPGHRPQAARPSKPVYIEQSHPF